MIYIYTTRSLFYKHIETFDLVYFLFKIDFSMYYVTILETMNDRQSPIAAKVQKTIRAKLVLTVKSDLPVVRFHTK